MPSGSGHIPSGKDATGIARVQLAQDDAELRQQQRKATRFFDHARAAHQRRQYDMAIECYLDGLLYQPDAIAEHQALMNLGIERRSQGKKAAGMIEQIKRSGGKTPLDRLLNAEVLWVKDPTNVNHAVKVMKLALAAGLEEVAYWAGARLMEIGRQAKKHSRNIYQAAAEVFEAIGAYDMAIEATRLLMKAGPFSNTLVRKLSELEAELAHATDWSTDDDEPQESEEDMLWLAAEGGTRSALEAEERELRRLRAEYEKAPNDLDAIQAVAAALVHSGTEENERDALKILNDAHARLGQYRLLMMIGDVHILRYERLRRRLRKQLAHTDRDGERRAIALQLRKLSMEQLRFELKEFADRVAHYPHDAGLRIQLGRRQRTAEQFEEAIKTFQKAASDPGYRSRALGYLGEIYVAREAFGEALRVFRGALEAHDDPQNRFGRRLRYELMQVLMAVAKDVGDVEQAREAAELADGIAAQDINYKNIRGYAERTRELVEELERKNGISAA